MALIGTYSNFTQTKQGMQAQVDDIWEEYLKQNRK